MKNKCLCILGAGGHGKVVLEIARLSGTYNDIVFFDDDISVKSCLDAPVVGTSQDFFNMSVNDNDINIVEVKIFSNKNNNGQAVYEIQYNGYVDYQGGAIKGFGMQSNTKDNYSAQTIYQTNSGEIVTTYLGGSLGKGLSEASTLTKLAAATPGNIAIGAGAEYLKTGQVTIQGVVCNGIFGASGTLQAIKMGGKIIQVPPGFKNFTTATNKIAQGTIASANN